MVSEVGSGLPQVIDLALTREDIVWDVLHDRILQKHRSLLILLSTSVVSVLMIGGLLILWYITQPDFPTVWSVVSADVALIGVISGFRAFKGWEAPLTKLLGADPKDLPPDRAFPWKKWTVSFLIVYLLGCGGIFISI